MQQKLKSITKEHDLTVYSPAGGWKHPHAVAKLDYNTIKSWKKVWDHEPSTLKNTRAHTKRIILKE